MGKVIVVVGGQFGSEGKGAIAGYLSAGEGDKLMAIRVGGPNAGHTVYVECAKCQGTGDSGYTLVVERAPRPYHGTCEACGGEGLRRYAFRQLPVAAVTNPESHCYIAAGSEVDSSVLAGEINEVGSSNLAGRFFIDSQATLLENHHHEQENGLQERLGSTQKGVGAARSARIMRRAKLMEGSRCDVAEEARHHLQKGGTVLVEGVQGFGLGLHAGYYPFCTSIDCRAIDMLALAGVNPWGSQMEIWVVLRTYPIRVAGNSGPLKDELTWDDLSRKTNGYIQPERTTVTQKIRRVGDFDADLAHRAIAANGGGEFVRLALTMYDYWFPGLANKQLEIHGEGTAPLGVLASDLGAPILLVGTGPSTITDRRKL